MQVIILAGGKGTRLAPYTTIFPKPLLPIGDKPILEIILRQLSSFGFKNITLSVNHLNALIRSYFDSVPIPGISLKYSVEDQPLGTAGPIGCIEGLDETFLVMNGDVLCNIDFERFFKQHQAVGATASMGISRREVKIDYGVMALDDNSMIRKYDEKPMFSYYVSMGIYLFEPAALKYVKPNERLDLPDLVARLLKDGHKVHGYSHDGYWLDIGRHEDYERAVNEYENYKPLICPDK